MIVVSAEDPDVVFAVPESRPGWCIVSRGNRFILTPLDPRAKIKVNGQPVQQRALKAGDEITVEDATYVVSAARVSSDAGVPVGNAPTGGDAQVGRAAPPKSDEDQFIEAGGDVVGIDMSPPAQEVGDGVADLLDDVIEAWEEDEKPAWAGGGGGKEPRERRKPKRQERERSGRRREAIKSDDGHIDIGASIKDRIRKVDIETLAKSKQHIKLLKMDVIEELVEAAVTETAARMGHALDEDARNKMLQETVEEFQSRLAAFTAEKEGMAEKNAAMEAELARQRRMLDEAKQAKVSKDQFTVSNEGIIDLEKQFARLVDGAKGKHGLDDALHDQLAAMVQGLLDSERAKIAAKTEGAQSEAIRLLEKKVARLAGSLSDAETDRDKALRLAKALEQAGGKGIASIMQAGLEEGDPDKARKLELMKVIFDENKRIRDAMGDKAKGTPKAEREQKRKTRILKRAEQEVLQEKKKTQWVEAATAPAEFEVPKKPKIAPLSPQEAGLDPDDMPWQPGMSFKSEPVDDDDDERDVPMITEYRKFEPPPLERKKS